MGLDALAKGENLSLSEAEADVIRRLRCAEGHTRGVERMVESGADCLDIVRQIHAIQGALEKVARLLLEVHLRECISDTFQEDDSPVKSQLVAELTDIMALSWSN